MTQKEILNYYLDKSAGKNHFRSTCPLCSEGRRKKNDKCVSVDIKEGKLFWSCKHCGEGGVIPLKEEAKEKIIEPKPKFTMPKNSKPLSDEVLTYFIERGISKTATDSLRITESVQFMPQVGKKRRCVDFNYYLDGELVGIKYKTRDKLFALKKGSKLTLYNADNIKHSDEVLITEGEMDAAAAITAGYLFASSVPNGATDTPKQNLSWLDDIYESHFANKKKIYIAPDADRPGGYLRDELVRRFGSDRCYIVSYPDECKDLNDVLIKHGKETVLECIKRAKEVPLEAVETVASNIESIWSKIKDGFDRGWIIGDRKVDKFVSLSNSDLNIIAGYTNQGKSNYVDWYMLRQAEMNGLKFGIVGFEKEPDIHAIELVEKLLNVCLIERPDQPVDQVDDESIMNALEWINDHFYWVTTSDIDITPEGICKKGQELVRRRGIDCLILDNISFTQTSKSVRDKDDAASHAMNVYRGFVKSNRCGMILLAHVRKPQGEGKLVIPSVYGILGSSQYANKADQVIMVSRLQDDTTRVTVRKMRFNFRGKTGFIDMDYNPKNGNLTVQEREVTTCEEPEQDFSNLFENQPEFNF